MEETIGRKLALRHECAVLYSVGFSRNEIAEKIGKSVSFVKKWWKREKNDIENFKV